MINIIYLLGIIHVLGDFYFQSEKIAVNKKEKKKYLFIHLLILLVISAVFLAIFGFGIKLLIVLTINLMAHSIIDGIKYCFNKRIDKTNRYEKIVYCIDQLLHIATMFILAFIYKDKSLFGSNWAIHTEKILKFFPLILAVLLNGKPANITFKILFSSFKPKTENDNIDEQNTNECIGTVSLDEKPSVSFKASFENFKPRIENDKVDEQNVGRWIGTLERLIVMLLFIMGEIGSVALIIAAKTLTRYKKITDDVKFAEYYLLGTLYSLGYSFIVAILLLKGFQI